MTTAIVVQARVGSTRLPGKVMKPLGAHTVLDEVLRRCRAIQGADVVVCAIPDDAEDDALVPVVERHAIVTRGSGSDVLARYAAAARAVEADIVMRVTSDCPLIDPTVCADVLALRTAENADYACNNMPPSFPHGLDCEAFTSEALYHAAADAKLPDEREHVTPWLRTNPLLRRVNLADPSGSAVDRRWTLDYPLDYEFFAELFALMPGSTIRPWRDVIDILERHPEVAAINQRHRAVGTR